MNTNLKRTSAPRPSSPIVLNTCCRRQKHTCKVPQTHKMHTHAHTPGSWLPVFPVLLRDHWTVRCCGWLNPLRSLVIVHTRNGPSHVWCCFTGGQREREAAAVSPEWSNFLFRSWWTLLHWAQENKSWRQNLANCSVMNSDACSRGQSVLLCQFCVTTYCLNCKTVTGTLTVCQTTPTLVRLRIPAWFAQLMATEEGSLIKVLLGRIWKKKVGSSVLMVVRFIC